MVSVSEAQVAEWQHAVGRELVEEETLDPLALRRFARAVGREDETGWVPLSHWAFFLPCPHEGSIGPDGHPERGYFLPKVTLPRRMFAASAMTFSRRLDTGAPARQTSRVMGLEHKAGRSGDLVFAEVERQIEQHGELCVREVQTYVYRGEESRSLCPSLLLRHSRAISGTPARSIFFASPRQPSMGTEFITTCLTREVEGYPALIVHGPFTATKLADLAMHDGTLFSFSFRAMAPLFLGQPILLRTVQKGSYEAVRCDGAVAMTANAEFI